MRQFIGVAAGIVLGVVGAILFQQSLPPDEGTATARLEETAHALGRAERRVAELEAEAGLVPGRGSKRTFHDEARSIAEDLRAGREVDIDEVFQAFKPVMRDLAPIFDRLRIREQQDHFDSMANRLAREYDMTPSQQSALQGWLEQRAVENAQRFNAMALSESSTLEDFIRATRDARSDDGLDSFMAQTLRGEALERFQADRMAQKVEQVQHEADRNVTRLDSIVGLDENQKDEVFVVMARGSRNFDPAMGIGGVGEGAESLAPGGSRDEAVRGVLRPEQQEALDAHYAEQRARAEADLAEVGLSLPDDWDLFENVDYWD